MRFAKRHHTENTGRKGSAGYKQMIPHHILATGMSRCDTKDGGPIDCLGTGQDGEFRPGSGWPVERFERLGDHQVRDLATRLITISALMQERGMEGDFFVII